jgi:hypothetical protein
MKFQKWFVPGLFSVCCLAAVIGSWALAQEKKDAPKKEATSKEAAVPEFKLPPGWTQADLQACIEAGTPGDMHALLTAGKGEWTGKCTMWMFPGADPMVSDVTSSVTSIMDGRFIKVEVKGDMPGMGPYHGVRVYGYDNAGKKFVSSWFDNHSTGIMQGQGELSKDKKTLSWKYNPMCPVTGKPTVMKDVETIVSDKERKLEAWATEPKSGKEYKMMQIDLVRK